MLQEQTASLVNEKRLVFGIVSIMTIGFTHPGSCSSDPPRIWSGWAGFGGGVDGSGDFFLGDQCVLKASIMLENFNSWSPLARLCLGGGHYFIAADEFILFVDWLATLMWPRPPSSYFVAHHFLVRLLFD